MKHLFKKLFLASSLCHFKYRLATDLELVKIKETGTIKKPASACLIDRTLFWAASRTYDGATLFDLKNIIAAEKSQFPMKGECVWSIKKISTKSIQVDYFVIPDNVLQKIPKECNFLVPIYEQGADEQNPPLSINKKIVLAHTDFIKSLSWINLFGLNFNKKRQVKQAEKLKTKTLLVSIASITTLVCVLLSGYMVWSINSYQNMKAENSEQVNAVLALKKKLSSGQEQTVGLINFLKKNPNVLNKFSTLDINPEGLFIENINLINTGFRLRGSVEGSATQLLQRLTQSPLIKEAKFSRPVTKTKQGQEVFTIEVVWK